MQKLEASGDYTAVKSRFDSAFASRREAAGALIAAHRAHDSQKQTASIAGYRAAQKELDAARRDAGAAVEKGFNDTNYIFLRFVVDFLPKGLIGLLIAVIFLAAWGSKSRRL